ncbi:ATP-binding protein [Desulfosporosinus burensis]
MVNGFRRNGTGLGLATCYSIVARHNATISFDSGPTGTTFYIRFNAC